MTTRPTIRAMTDEDVPGAARMLAERHRAHRVVRPFLPARFEEASACEAEVAAAWRTNGASGAVAVQGTQMLGFLLGAPRSSPVWGPNVWVEAAGHAAHDAEVLRDL